VRVLEDSRSNKGKDITYVNLKVFEIELPSELELAYMILDCRRKLGFKISEKERQEWSKAVLNYLRPDGVFGSGIDIDTFQAVAVVESLLGHDGGQTI
jgi:hypothetical protein